MTRIWTSMFFVALKWIKSFEPDRNWCDRIWWCNLNKSELVHRIEQIDALIWSPNATVHQGTALEVVIPGFFVSVELKIDPFNGEVSRYARWMFSSSSRWRLRTWRLFGCLNGGEMEVKSKYFSYFVICRVKPYSVISFVTRYKI